jgi:hypothetical protein
VLGYFDVSLNRQSLRWQIGLFIVWLLATALVALCSCSARRAPTSVAGTAQELELVVRHAPAGMAACMWAVQRLSGPMPSWRVGWAAASSRCAVGIFVFWCRE